MALRAYKYRLYPNRLQAMYLIHNFGAVRYLWNHLTENFNSWTPEFTPPKLNEKILKDQEGNEWMHDVISYALQQKRIDFEETKRQFFNKKRKTKLGRMKYKKRGVSRDSFRIPGSVLPKANLEMCETGLIVLPKMEPMKVVIDRPFTGAIKSVTVSKNKCNQYFVSVLVDEPIEPKQNTGRSVGIDLGLNHFITTSDGTKVDNPRWFRENQAKLKRAQQHLSRKQKGSNRYQHQKLKVARIHNKIVNQRNWFHHNLSTWLVNNYHLIAIEDLNIAGMMKSNLAKSVSDAGWSSFVSMLSYKAQWYGSNIVKIDRWYPSSKTCSCCGHKMESMDLSVREWSCPSCSTQHDRDHNAAVNMLQQGLMTHYDFTSAELTDYRRREAVRPEVGVIPLKASSLKRLAYSIY